MKPLCVFYHVWIPKKQSMWIVREQINAIKESGLDSAASEIHIGVNRGYEYDVSSIAPEKSHIHSYVDQRLGEMPTMFDLQSWLPNHDEWYVCYHHTKGISSSIDKSVARRCMTEGVITNWKRCVSDLDSGCDAVGCHWLYWPKNAVPKEHRLFGGNFWWAKASYLLQLPPLRLKAHESGRFFEGEIWIGRRGRMPIVKDYHPEGRPCAL